ncbi:argininosuccinate lyase [Halovenus sp. WSH3]|uniref:Argininosuccinate lyase n=1 Tax=Halovenus carboxidivorans TaxID=2692199 RepID=A0A6B0T1K1_9EURY|nr:argininosuccinate lyase [Halovenus carboxidivorans]MXR50106.1 argininosuccinate lyase [Halovenus carboxidivorans]
MTDPEEHGDADDGGDSVVRRERFSGGPAREFLSSLSADERIFAADLAVDRAHVVMLAEQEIIGPDTAGEILRALAAVEQAGHEDLPEGEDVHEAIETAVIDRVGPEGGRMHTARSRNDEVATCIRYRLREDVLELIETVVEAREQLLDVAAEHTETVMPGYTHLQPAQPTTVAHWLCSYESALARDTARLIDAYERTNQSPLGGAAFAGTPFDIDRERTAELLGFDGLVENAMDGASARDFLVETTAAVTGLATTLSGLAEDVVTFANRGHVEVADEYASTSSIMPQKKNPDTLELVRGRTGDATAGLNGLLTTLKGLPRAYNRDLQRAGRHAYDAIDSVTASTEVAVGAVVTAEWPADDLADAAGEGFSTATGVADRLAQAGIPFRTAHEIVARAGEAADPDIEAIGAAVEAELGESLEEVADREAIEAALDPEESVRMRDSRGGPAPAALRAHLDRVREDLRADQEVLADRRESIAAAATTLDSEVNRYV